MRVESTQLNRGIHYVTWHGKACHGNTAYFRVPRRPSIKVNRQARKKAGVYAAAKQSKAQHARTIPLVSSINNRTMYKLLCWVQVSGPWRNKHWPAHLMLPAVQRPVLLRDWVVIRTRPSAPRVSSSRPHGCFGGVSRVRAASPHPIFSLVLAMLCPPANSLSTPGTRLDWAGRQASRNRLELNGRGACE